MFGYLQKIGRALMIPVAVLPAAAILMGIGYWIDPTGWGSNSIIAALLIKSGGAIIDQMPLLFAVGVAFGMSHDKNGSAALTGLVGYLVVTTLLSPGTVSLLTGVAPEAVPAAFGKINNQFIGILVGVIGAQLYNKFSGVELPKVLSFFSGRRLVPIVMSFTMIVLAYILLEVWPIIFGGLVHFGTTVSEMGSAGAGIFGFFNRLLIPFGLHHALNSVFWFDVAGINDIPNFLAGASGSGIAGITGRYQAGFFPIMMFGLPAAALAFITTARPENRDKVKSIMIAAAFTAFFTGVTEPLEFAFMFLAPPLYILHAIYSGIALFIAAHFEWMSGFGFSAGLVDFVLSARNPLAVKWYMLIVLGVITFAVYYVSFVFLIKKFNMKTPGREDEDEQAVVMVSGPALEKAQQILPLLGGAENIDTFDYCVTRIRLEVKDTSKINVAKLNEIVPGVLIIDSKHAHVIIGTRVESITLALRHVIDGDINATPSSHAELAAAILVHLGGKSNLTVIDNCITRLRLEVKDSAIVNVPELKKITAGVIVAGKKSVQVIVGTEVEFVAKELKKLI